MSSKLANKPCLLRRGKIMKCTQSRRTFPLFSTPLFPEDDSLMYLESDYWAKTQRSALYRELFLLDPPQRDCFFLCLVMLFVKLVARLQKLLVLFPHITPLRLISYVNWIFRCIQGYQVWDSQYVTFVERILSSLLSFR